MKIDIWFIISFFELNFWFCSLPFRVLVDLTAFFRKRQKKGIALAVSEMRYFVLLSAHCCMPIAVKGIRCSSQQTVSLSASTIKNQFHKFIQSNRLIQTRPDEINSCDLILYTVCFVHDLHLVATYANCLQCWITNASTSRRAQLKSIVNIFGFFATKLLNSNLKFNIITAPPSALQTPTWFMAKKIQNLQFCFSLEDLNYIFFQLHR